MYTTAPLGPSFISIFIAGAARPLLPCFEDSGAGGQVKKGCAHATPTGESCAHPFFVGSARLFSVFLIVGRRGPAVSTCPSRVGGAVTKHQDRVLRKNEHRSTTLLFFFSSAARPLVLLPSRESTHVLSLSLSLSLFPSVSWTRAPPRSPPPRPQRQWARVPRCWRARPPSAATGRRRPSSTRCVTEKGGAASTRACVFFLALLAASGAYATKKNGGQERARVARHLRSRRDAAVAAPPLPARHQRTTRGVVCDIGKGESGGLQSAAPVKFFRLRCQSPTTVPRPLPLPSGPKRWPSPSTACAPFGKRFCAR